jgi:hypothetical protein
LREIADLTEVHSPLLCRFGIASHCTKVFVNRGVRVKIWVEGKSSALRMK